MAGTISFSWEVLHTARTVTKEEDMLGQLFGHEDADERQAELPWLRIDIELSASLPWGKPMPMPSKSAWAAWVREVMGRLEDIEPLTTPEKVLENDVTAARTPRSTAWSSLAWLGHAEAIYGGAAPTVLGASSGGSVGS